MLSKLKSKCKTTVNAMQNYFVHLLFSVFIGLNYSSAECRNDDLVDCFAQML